MADEAERVELDRLAALRSLEILDTSPEEEFNSLVEVASKACGTPISFLTLVDAERLWFKAKFGGPDLLEVPRKSNFCSATITGDDVLEIHDTRLDPEFRDLEAVRGQGGVRFYAGAPIRLSDGHKVGTVCVLDVKPRRLDATQREVLRCLALAAARGLEARKALLAQHRVTQSLHSTMVELDRSREQLRRNYEATPAMMHSIDPEGRLIMVSDMWLKKLGYRRKDVIGRLTTDFFTEASRHYANTTVLPHFFQSGHCANIAYQMVCRDGSIIDVLLAAVLEQCTEGGVRRSLTVIEDVTDRLRTERALEESEANYRRLTEATNDVITEVDMTLVRRYVSPACRLVLGYEPEEMIGRDPRGNIHPDDAAGVHSIFEQLAAGALPGDRAMVTYRSRHKQGHWIWLEVGLNLVRDREDGTPRHMICALRDVSERRRVAEELEAARAAAERAVQSRSEFLANMSHELRTPLTGLLGIHDLLVQETDLAPQHRRKVALAHEAGRSLMAVINDVLDYSKIEAGQLAIEAVPFDLDGLVTACRDFACQDAARKGLALDATAPQGLTLTGDPTRLRQVLLNLVTNAVKFTAEGRVGIAATYEAGRLRLAVSDTGIGIPADKLTAIFERFRQADGSITRQFGGTGLGLSICKNLVELMGGTIAVASVPGSGSTFTVDIPAIPALPLTSPRNTGPLRAAASRRLLVAEDNRLNRAIVVEMLSRAGHRVTAVENGAEAVARLGGGEAFDLVLMDIQMPVLDGYSATRLIRDREGAGRRIPIIGLTANATVEDEASCAAAGMDAHVAKPIDWAELLNTIEQVSDPAPIPPWSDDEARIGSDAVLDRSSLEALAEIIGPARLSEMLQSFVAELRSQACRLSDMAEAELTGCAHGWISMAGHFGFAELQHSAAELQADARAGRGFARKADLKAAAERAVLAAEACTYAWAA